MLLRKDKKLTQGELADVIEETRGKIGHYEAGNNLPPLTVLVKLAGIFEVSLDKLVFGKESDYAAIQQGLVEATANDNYEGIQRENEILKIRFEDLKREMNTLRAYTALLEKNLMKYEESGEENKKKTN